MKSAVRLSICVHVPQAVADHIPQLVQGVRASQGQPEDGSAQLTLIIASQNFLQVVQLGPYSESCIADSSLFKLNLFLSNIDVRCI